MHHSCDPAAERTLRQALKRVSDDDRRRLCASLAEWCECTDLGDVLVDSKRRRQLPKSVSGLIPETPRTWLSVFAGGFALSASGAPILAL